MIPRPFRIVAFVLGCSVVLWLSLAPTDFLPPINLWDKLKHAFAYLGLAILGAVAFPNHLWRMVSGLFTFGVGVEVFQASMALGREGDPADALANSAGIAAGLLLTLAIRDRIKARSPTDVE